MNRSTPTLPYSPPHSKKWLDKFFAKSYYKKPYSQFMWWRSFTPKNKPLTNRHPFRDRVLNGDFDVAPYLLESELTEHKMNEKFLGCVTTRGEVDYGKWREETSVDKARRKRLLEDYEKEEANRLSELRKGFIMEFKMTKEDYDEEVVNTNAEEIIDFYYEMEEKYGKWARPLKKVPKF